MNSLRISAIFMAYLLAMASGHPEESSTEESSTEESSTEEESSAICAQEDGFVFNRMLILQGAGPPPTSNVSRDTLLESWGSSVDTDETVREMIKFFESKGYDMSGPRSDPFSFYSDDQYKLETTEASSKRVVMASLFDFARFSNRPVTNAGWRLTNKKAYLGHTGIVPVGATWSFGVMRLHMHGRDFGMQCKSRDFTWPMVEGQRLLPVEMDIYSPEWKEGIARGLATKVSPGYIEIRHVITFPANSS